MVRFAGTWVIALAVLVVSLAGTARAEEWQNYDARLYGFSMLIPADAEVTEKMWDGGWGGLYVTKGGDTELYGLARLGVEADPGEIEAFAVAVTGTENWKEIDSAENHNGWTWYRTARATKGRKAFIGGYGIGPWGSFLMILKTTKEKVRAEEADFRTWYDSVTLHALPEGWKLFVAKEHGFTMLIPDDAEVHTREWGAWDGLYITRGGPTELYGIAKLGVQADPEAIEAFAVEVSGTDSWEEIDSGENYRGWTWYRTGFATKGNNVLLGGYGVGPRGSFLMLLKTTKKQFEANEAAFRFWYESVVLYR
jgi:hypothetical protein